MYVCTYTFYATMEYYQNPTPPGSSASPNMTIEQEVTISIYIPYNTPSSFLPSLQVRNLTSNKHLNNKLIDFNFFIEEAFVHSLKKSIIDSYYCYSFSTTHFLQPPTFSPNLTTRMNVHPSRRRKCYRAVYEYKIVWIRLIKQDNHKECLLSTE